MDDGPSSPLKLQAGIIPVTPLQQNCTLLWDRGTTEGVVIDPGGDVKNILASVDKAGITVKKIVLTHGHIDHAGGAHALREKLGVPLEGPHEDDNFLLESLRQSGAEYGITDAENVKPDKWMNHGDVLKMAGADWQVFHCPGHSPGSLVYYQKEAKIAIVGDVLFRGSIGRTDLPRGNHEDLLNSIRDHILPLGDDVSFLCGHGPGSSIGHERKTNPFLQGLS
ncbi:MAG: MBL fold metallo-hydrolase [Hyphomicrobiales bacterium]